MAQIRGAFFLFRTGVCMGHGVCAVRTKQPYVRMALRTLLYCKYNIEM